MHFRISSSVAFFISSATALSWKVCTSLSVRFLPSMKCSLNYLLQLLYKLWGGSFSLLKPLIEVSIFPLVSRTIALFCFQFDNECMIKEECPTILELLVGTLLRVCCKGWAEIANCPWKLRFIWAFFKSFFTKTCPPWPPHGFFFSFSHHHFCCLSLQAEFMDVSFAAHQLFW